MLGLEKDLGSGSEQTILGLIAGSFSAMVSLITHCDTVMMLER